jgi:hypothetical protein
MGPTGVDRRVGLGRDRPFERAIRAGVTVGNARQKHVGSIACYDEPAFFARGIRTRVTKISLPETGAAETVTRVRAAVIETGVWAAAEVHCPGQLEQPVVMQILGVEAVVGCEAVVQ